MKRQFAAWRKRRLLARWGIPEAAWSRLVTGVHPLAGLDDAQLTTIRLLSAQFLRDKEFVGCDGLVVQPAMAWLIAVEAVLPVLDLGYGYLEGWTSVLVYPGAYVAEFDYHDESGVTHREAAVRSGETSPGGPLVVSWDDMLHDLYDNRSVVIHEIAHKIDFQGAGRADGDPPLREGMDAAEWTRIMRAAYDSLVQAIDAGDVPPIDEYAAESPAEFFAVTSEWFFCSPLQLRHVMPGVAEQLAALYGVEPRALPHDARTSEQLVRFLATATDVPSDDCGMLAPDDKENHDG